MKEKEKEGGKGIKRKERHFSPAAVQLQHLKRSVEAKMRLWYIGGGDVPTPYQLWSRLDVWYDVRYPGIR
jgi:hypothetical protein